MSANRNISDIPTFKKTAKFRVTQKGSSMCKIDSNDLDTDLKFVPDPAGSNCVIEPGRLMSLKKYQEALNDLQKKFNKVCH